MSFDRLTQATLIVTSGEQALLHKPFGDITGGLLGEVAGPDRTLEDRQDPDQDPATGRRSYSVSGLARGASEYPDSFSSLTGTHIFLGLILSARSRTRASTWPGWPSPPTACTGSRSGGTGCGRSTRA